ncbi:hypothetical protein GCM10027299_05130 [Larkinella ripae]
MKTAIKSLLVAFAFTMTSFSVAQADVYKPLSRTKKAAAFQSSLYTTQEGKLQIAVNKEMGNTVQIRLVNAAGKEFFVQQIGKHQQAARLRLDVSNLPDGNYQVVISNGVETTTQQLTLATQPPVAAPRFVAVN